MDEHERKALVDEDEVERRLRLGKHLELVPDLFDAVNTEPLRERRSKQLMLALYRCGRQLEALREFHRLHESLGEVGLEPSVEVTHLEWAIATDQPELTWTGPDSIAY
jgi:DNA-binding SARP family transcriptional activator